MVKCKFEHGGYCCNCGAMQYMDKCEKPCDTIEPISNADRIRAMTDEELAEWLICLHTICDCCSVREECETMESDVVCRQHIEEWLKQPVKDGEDDGESAD